MQPVSPRFIGREVVVYYDWQHDAPITHVCVLEYDTVDC
jgi:hypothetical protein